MSVLPSVLSGPGTVSQPSETARFSLFVERHTMGFALTTNQAASFLTDQLTTGGTAPTITDKKVLAQVRAGLFPSVGDGRQVRIDSDVLAAFARKTRYVQDPEEIDREVFRVSVLERQERNGAVLDRATGALLSELMGVDYTKPQDIDGVEGVWELSEVNCERMIDTACTLLATCKGYVHPDHVRSVIGWRRIEGSSRKYFDTTVARANVRGVVGTGIWIDVPPGRESDFLVRGSR